MLSPTWDTVRLTLHTLAATIWVGGQFTLAGLVPDVEGTLTIDGRGDVSIQGVVSGSGGLTKSGSGTLSVSGSNTYSGGSSISAGTLKVGVAAVGSVGAVTSSALGTANVNVVSGATLDLYGFTLPNALSIAGTGVSSNGALSNTAATPISVTGAITLTGASTFSSTPGITARSAKRMPTISLTASASLGSLMTGSHNSCKAIKERRQPS